MVRRISVFVFLFSYLVLLLPFNGEAAGISIDPRFRRIESDFQDARDHLRDGETTDAFNEIQDVIDYFQGLRYGTGAEKVDGRARKLLHTSVLELESLKRLIGTKPELAQARLPTVYQNAVNALAEHIRKPHGNSTGKLIKRRDIAAIKQALIADF